MGDSLESVKQLLRSVLISSKAGIKASRLQGDYQELCGGYIPHTKFGFSSLHDFIVSVNDVVRVGRNHDNELTYYAVADSSTQHIQDLVSKQRSKAKPKKKAPPSFSRNKFSSKPNLKSSFYRYSSNQPVKKKYFSSTTRQSRFNRVSNKENKSISFNQSSFNNVKNSIPPFPFNSASQGFAKNTWSKDLDNAKISILTNSKNSSTSNIKDFVNANKKAELTNNYSKKTSISSDRSYSRQNSTRTHKSNIDNRREFNKHLPPRFAKKVLAQVFSEISLYDNPLHSDELDEPKHNSVAAQSSQFKFSKNSEDQCAESNENLDNWNFRQEASTDSFIDKSVNQPQEPLLSDQILSNLKKLLSIYEYGLHLSGVPSLYKETFGEELSTSLLNEIADGDDIRGYISVEKVDIPGNKKCILFPYVERQSYNEMPPEAVSVSAHAFLIMGIELFHLPVRKYMSIWHQKLIYVKKCYH